MSSSLDSFRRLDVDQYDPDRVLPHELYTPDPRPPHQVLDDTHAKAANVRASLQRGDLGTALHEVLDQPPYGDGVQQAKTIALQSVLSILNSTRSTDIPQLIQALDPNEKVVRACALLRWHVLVDQLIRVSLTTQATLMKYLYKAMENLGETSGNVVLGWHEKLVQVAGTGCIVRVMTDRRRL
ncbi:BQ2448_7034 [Microbotryum intermedium]|uniref:Actin-related protein 2/3 complex subunit 5 n=1 Tax=Microbotryum intermedium TaxID=269621 RepID=A0A238FJY5_9BASI|nr:BQ2448_7034 [Microbotryum intermedium]